MKYLVDTHALLWIITQDDKLSPKAKKIYLNDKNDIFFSLASIWEIAIKSSIGKITLEKSLEHFIEEHITGNNIQILKIKIPHIIKIENLPLYHHDPFERLIISQVIEEKLTISSNDKIFDKYKIQRIW